MANTLRDSGQVQRLSRNEVRLLWYGDFWDGPINGLCLCGNVKCWFEMWNDEDRAIPDTTHRRFLVRELSLQQLAEEERWHELFRQKVGTHCDLDEAHPEVKSNELHREFYEAYEQRSKPDYSTNRIIGWFEMS